MKRIFIAAAFALVQAALFAQTASDVLRFSYLQPGGTARSMGIGGAIGALGADFATLSTNPAGLATYRKSEFMFTPSFSSNITRAKLNSSISNNNEFRESDNTLGFSNVGVVFATRPGGEKWKNFNIGIGTNCLANYNHTGYYEGYSKGSITDRYVDQANAKNFDQFESNLAISTGAIYLPKGATRYVNDFVGFEDSAVFKKQNIQSGGSYNELALSFAGNYDDRVMMGATIGIPFIRFNENKTYEEKNSNNLNTPFDRLVLNENLNTSGVGINAKLGLIYRATQMVRLGFAVHTPTTFSMTDKYNTDLRYRYTEGGITSDTTAYSPEGSFNYRLNTPWRAIGSVGFIFGKMGFLSGEVEFVDYSASNYRATGDRSSDNRDYEREINNRISTEFQQAVNIRLGGEIAADIFRFRAGVAMNGSPYKNSKDNSPNMVYTGGIGIRANNFFVDIAYQRAEIRENYIPYLASTVQQLIQNNQANNNFILTIGFKF